MDRDTWLDSYSWYFYAELQPAYMDSWMGAGCESILTYCNKPGY